MEIGTVNVSAIIGTYSHPVAMTTDKFSVPYLVTSTSDVRQRRRQSNVISILPLDVDLVAVTVDFISLTRWTSVAVVCQPDRGIHDSVATLTYSLSLMLRVTLLSLVNVDEISLFASRAS